MKHRRSLFLHLNQLKILAKKIILLLLFLVALLLMLFSREKSLMLEKSSGVATGVVAFTVDILVLPAKFISSTYDYFNELRAIKKNNRRLVEENKKLRVYKDKYEMLKVENGLLADLLNYVPLPEAGYVSARIVAGENDAFSQSVVAYVGDAEVFKGDVVLSDVGLVGRVDKVSGKYVKIILITDINSKIPVVIESSRIRGALSGDNTSVPKLVFLPLDAEVSVRDRVVTSGVSGVFPAGLPVGEVVNVNKNEIKVKPFAALDKLEYVKIINYGLGGILADEEVSDE